MVKLPKLKKKICAFLTKEDGKISKEALIKTGILLSAAAVASIRDAGADCPPNTAAGHSDHCNQLGLSYASSTAVATHNDANHNSHYNHSNHSSGGWC
jgi:hypothetical protein